MTTCILKKATQHEGGVAPNTIFRYSMSHIMTEEVFAFSKTHQFDDRHQFKESWEKWIIQEDIRQIFDQEIELMCEKGYKGDIITKIFKSARYYYRKRESLEIQPETSPRKEYSRLSKTFLQSIDSFIEDQANSQEKKTKKSAAPANIFNEYCIQNQDILRMEIASIVSNYNKINNEPIDAYEIEEKIKKTFKNREYNIRKRANN
jgi:hypothetical protein